jgi:hypothetical protein
MVGMAVGCMSHRSRKIPEREIGHLVGKLDIAVY